MNLSHNDALSCAQLTGLKSKFGAALTHSESCDSTIIEGRLRWQFSIPGESSTTPAIGPDGTLYIGSSDKNLYALNPDGSQKWVFPTQGLVSAPSISNDGIIYATSSDGNLYAINADGSQLWAVKHWTGSVNSPAIATDGSLYVDNNEVLYALNSFGDVNWEYKSTADIYAVKIGPLGNLFVSTAKGLELLTSQGEKSWSFDTRYFSFVIASDSSISLFSNEGAISRHYGIELDRNVKWANAAGDLWSTSAIMSRSDSAYIGNRDPSYGVAVVNSQGGTGGFVVGHTNSMQTGALAQNDSYYFGSTDLSDQPYFKAYKNREETWAFKPQSRITGSASIGIDGTVYVSDSSGNVYAFETNNGGLQDATWPREGADNANTKNAAH